MSTVQEVERLFDREAYDYDGIVGGNGWPANDMLYAELGKLPRVGRVLDLGAGTGLTTEAALRAAPECVVAVDVSAEMLRILRARCGEQPRVMIARMAIDRFLADTGGRFASTEMVGHLRSRHNAPPCSAARRRPISQFGGIHARFDLVVAIGLFHFLPDPEEIIAGISRVLGKDGRCIFTYDPYVSGHATNGEPQTEFDVTVYRSTPEEITHGLRRNGLELVSDRLFVPKPNRDDTYLARFVVAKK